VFTLVDARHVEANVQQYDSPVTNKYTMMWGRVLKNQSAPVAVSMVAN